MRLKTVLKQGFHGAEDGGIGLASQDRDQSTLSEPSLLGRGRWWPRFAVRGADQGHAGPVAKAQPFAYAMTGSVVEAFGAYADLAGQPIYMSGTFTLTDDGGPATAPGVIEFG